MILFEIERFYESQEYLHWLYKALFSLAYYRLFRVGELTSGDHPVRAKDVHMADNKDKLRFYLCTSKTHGKGDHPQKIVIEANYNDQSFRYKRHFCPFEITNVFVKLRGKYIEDSDPFFVFRDNSPVRLLHMCKVLRKSLSSIGLNPKLYDTHSFRIGHVSDIVLRFGKTIEEAKIAGHWKSNIVYRYIRDL